MLADKGYGSDAIVAAIQTMAAFAVLPSRSCRKLQRSHHTTLYKLRDRNHSASDFPSRPSRLRPRAASPASASD